MRKIKFRGKAKMSIKKLNELGLKHENGWVYGHLVMYGKIPYIVGYFIEVDAEYTVNEFWVEVIPDTVGQFSGLKDKNGHEIYEGDIVECFNNGNSYVSFKGGVYGLVSDYGFVPFSDIHGKMKVIGNIYENPELLEGEGKINEFCPTCSGSGGIEVFDWSIGEVVTIPCPDCGGSEKATDVEHKELEGEE